LVIRRSFVRCARSSHSADVLYGAACGALSYSQLLATQHGPSGLPRAFGSGTGLRVRGWSRLDVSEPSREAGGVALVGDGAVGGYGGGADVAGDSENVRYLEGRSGDFDDA
jgi:hypothetical protein